MDPPTFPWGLTPLSWPHVPHNKFLGFDWGSLSVGVLEPIFLTRPPTRAPRSPLLQKVVLRVLARPILLPAACSLGNRCPLLSLLDCSSVNPTGPLGSSLWPLQSPSSHFGKQRS